MTFTIAERLANTSIRSVAMAAKFSLIFILVRFLPQDDVALYGLFVATVAFALLLAGLEFYTFTTREFLQMPLESRSWVLKNHLSLGLVTHLALLGPVLAFFAADFLPLWLGPWFIVVLVLEHLAQEINRILIAMSEQRTASLVLFLRIGLWVVGITLAMVWIPETRNLTSVLAAWVAGTFLACAVGLRKVFNKVTTGQSAPVDWRWVVRGIHIAIPMLAGTIAIRSIMTVDRYWVDATLGGNFLAAYVLFMGVGLGLITLLDAGIFSYVYPALVAMAHNAQVDQFRSLVRRTLMQTIVTCGGYVVLAMALVRPLTQWLGGTSYVVAIDLFPWVLVAMVLQALQTPAHHGLYAMRADGHIVASQIVAAVVFVVATWGATEVSLMVAVPFGLSVAFTILLVWKWAAYASVVAHCEAKVVRNVDL